MLQPVSYGLEAEPTARAAAAVEASVAEPRKHVTVANALSQALNMPDMALVTHHDHYSPTPGRLLDESGLVIAANWQTWMREQIDLANGNAVTVWERYREKAWTTTEWRPNLLYFSGQTGGRAWDFHQVAVRAQQEFTSKRLFSRESWYRPHDKRELLDGNCAGPVVENAAALSPIRYSLKEIVDFGKFVDLGTQLYSEISTSSAIDL
ncbi:hypothetical protein LP417_35560 (plasmid) [Polaromonas sp. P1-6]|nr:hypothetical protein LP417_35560 [Polaromonas sp. P1-6]